MWLHLSSGCDYFQEGEVYDINLFRLCVGLCLSAGPEDNVRCYYCDGGLKNWQLTDEPWTEHRHWFPRCPHLQARQNGIHIAATQVLILASL